MYVRKHFNKADREVAMDMIEDLKEAFRDMLVNNEWMEQHTRQYALEKVRPKSWITSTDNQFRSTK